MIWPWNLAPIQKIISLNQFLLILLSVPIDNLKGSRHLIFENIIPFTDTSGHSVATFWLGFEASNQIRHFWPILMIIWPDHCLSITHEKSGVWCLFVDYDFWVYFSGKMGVATKRASKMSGHENPAKNLAFWALFWVNCSLNKSGYWNFQAWTPP